MNTQTVYRTCFADTRPVTTRTLGTADTERGSHLTARGRGDRSPMAKSGFSAMKDALIHSYRAAASGARRIGLTRRPACPAGQIGPYKLIRLLGRGGMGEVYLAEHQYLERLAAVKVIRPENADDPTSIARFESEVRATARLTHWNTVEIHDFGRAEDGRFYYAMEYLPGMNLQELVDQFGPLPCSRALYLLRQICGALGEAHESRLVHRDIKPGNIFATQRGGQQDVAKLLDFGLVKSTAGADRHSMKLTMKGTVIGSPLYTAPEIVMGDSEATVQSDIYSLGAVAYFLVTGKPVFDRETPLKVVFAHVHDEVVPPSQWESSVPADLERVILRCLEKNPRDRYEDVAALETALSRCECVNQWSGQSARQWWKERDCCLPAAPKSISANVTTTIQPC